MPVATPTVSIVIPAYRKAATLARALQSVANQSYRDFELHVVDDSGNEDLRPLVAQYAVTTYTPQNCQGPGAARNRGLTLCTGRYVISLDHDDEWDPDFLEQAVEAIEHHHADAIWMNFRISGIRDRADCLATSPSRRKLFAHQTEKSWLMTHDQACRFYLGRMAPLSNSAMLFRREKLGTGWYEKAMMADDWLLMARLLMDPAIKTGIVAAPSWTKHEDGSHRSLWSQETGRRCVHDVTYAWQHYSPAMTPANQQQVRLYLGNLHYKLAYHCFWAGDHTEGRDNVRLGRCLAGITGQSLLLVMIFALRKLARAAGLPPLSTLNRAPKQTSTQP